MDYPVRQRLIRQLAEKTPPDVFYATLLEFQQLMVVCPPSEFCFSHTRERWEFRGTPIKVKYGNQA